MVKCSRCANEIYPLEVFPEGLCLNCHALDFDSKPMPTAQEIRQMWGMN